jgi:hypothetical protein
LTILYSLWEKKTRTTKKEIEMKMQLPLDILEEIGQTYGPTKKLHQALASLVQATIENLEHSRNVSDVSNDSLHSSDNPLISPPMQLPLRIDASLQFESSNSMGLVSGAVPGVPPSASMAPLPFPNSTLSWAREIINGHPNSSVQSESRPSANDEEVKSGAELDPPHYSSHENLDTSMVWAPSLEWTSGWDDFLNAIAM